MVTKLEIVLTATLLLFGGSWLLSKDNIDVKKVTKPGVQAHLVNSKLIEIDFNGSKKVLVAADAKQYKDRVDFKQFYYKSDKVALSSNYAREKKTIYTLWNNVVAKRADGAQYGGQKAIYAKKSETLKFVDKFNLHDGSNSIVGKKMHYDELSGSVKANNVKAIYEMPNSH